LDVFYLALKRLTTMKKEIMLPDGTTTTGKGLPGITSVTKSFSAVSYVFF
jgi:hypothetical protein